MTGTDLIVVSADKLPAVVQHGIVGVVMAFTVGSPNADDMALRLSIYAEAVEGFPQAVVEQALKHLRLHNPRNPFPPTPQDVHETCKAIIAKARAEQCAEEDRRRLRRDRIAMLQTEAASHAESRVHRREKWGVDIGEYRHAAELAQLLQEQEGIDGEAM